MTRFWCSGPRWPVICMSPPAGRDGSSPHSDTARSLARSGHRGTSLRSSSLPRHWQRSRCAWWRSWCHLGRGAAARRLRGRGRLPHGQFGDPDAARQARGTWERGQRDGRVGDRVGGQQAARLTRRRPAGRPGWPEVDRASARLARPSAACGNGGTDDLRLCRADMESPAWQLAGKAASRLESGTLPACRRNTYSSPGAATRSRYRAPASRAAGHHERSTVARAALSHRHLIWTDDNEALLIDTYLWRNGESYPDHIPSVR